MNEDLVETLSAFVDGEEVDVKELGEALKQRGALEALINFVALRGQIRKDDVRPSQKFYETVRPSEKSRRGLSRRILYPVPAVAAVLLALVVGLGVWAGLTTHRAATAPDDVPPPVDRVMRFESGVDWHALSDQGSGG